MYEEGGEEQSYAPPAGGFKNKISYHFEGLIPLILIVIVAVLAGAFLGLWDIPFITPTAPVRMLVIGQPSHATIAVLDESKDLVAYRIRDVHSLSVSPQDQLAQFDIILLDQSHSAEGPFMTRALGEGIQSFVRKGGKLIVVQSSGILRTDAPEVVGWLANFGDIMPVECTRDKHNVATCIQPMRIRAELVKLDFDHDIMEGIERVPALPGLQPLQVETFDVAVKGKEIGYLKDIDSPKWYPGITERSHILGKVIHFNYDPGLTRAIFQQTIKYLR